MSHQHKVRHILVHSFTPFFQEVNHIQISLFAVLAIKRWSRARAHSNNVNRENMEIVHQMPEQTVKQSARASIAMHQDDLLLCRVARYERCYLVQLIVNVHFLSLYLVSDS